MERAEECWRKGKIMEAKEENGSMEGIVYKEGVCNWQARATYGTALLYVQGSVDTAPARRTSGLACLSGELYVAPVTGYSQRCTNISIYVTSLGEADEYYKILIQKLRCP